MRRFEKLEDASKHVDDQLVLRGFLNSNQSLCLRESVGTNEDAKLVINTMHRLITCIDDKNRQLETAYSAIEDLKKDLNSKPVTVREISSPSTPNRTDSYHQHHRAKPVQVTKSTKAKNDDRTARTFQVKLNRLEALIDELKWQLNYERNKNSRRSYGNDITWSIQESIQGEDVSEKPPVDAIDQYRDEITGLRIELQQFLHDRDMISRHLANVNRFTYSMGVLDIHPKSQENIEGKEWSNWIEQLEKDDSELKELIQDWYEIVEIAKRAET